MQYIDDVWPRRIIDIEKYRTNLLMRKEREKFLKNSAYVCHEAWRIHKKLYQERFGRMYYWIARGNHRWRDTEYFFDLLESGRDVQVMNARDAFTKPPKNYIFDPCWVTRPDGSMYIREISLIPNPEKGASNAKL